MPWGNGKLYWVLLGSTVGAPPCARKCQSLIASLSQETVNAASGLTHPWICDPSSLPLLALQTVAIKSKQLFVPKWWSVFPRAHYAESLLGGVQTRVANWHLSIKRHIFANSSISDCTREHKNMSICAMQFKMLSVFLCRWKALGYSGVGVSTAAAAAVPLSSEKRESAMTTKALTVSTTSAGPY